MLVSCVWSVFDELGDIIGYSLGIYCCHFLAQLLTLQIQAHNCPPKLTWQYVFSPARMNHLLFAFDKSCQDLRPPGLRAVLLVSVVVMGPCNELAIVMQLHCNGPAICKDPYKDQKWPCNDLATTLQ